MKKLLFPVVLGSMACMYYSCKPVGPDHNWDRFVNTGDSIVKIEPIVLENGEVLLMTGNQNGETFADGSDANKKCNGDSEFNCTKYGGQYNSDNLNDGKSMEEAVANASIQLDTDGDGKLDVADKITSEISNTSLVVSETVATNVVTKMLSDSASVSKLSEVAEATADKVLENVFAIDPSASIDQAELSEKVLLALYEVFSGDKSVDLIVEIKDAVNVRTSEIVEKYLQEHPLFIDEEELFALVQEGTATVVQNIVQDYIQEAIEVVIGETIANVGLSTTEKETIVKTVALESSQDVGNDLIAEVATEQAIAVQVAVGKVILEQFTEVPVQGICADGEHIPSDNEWKKIELSFGMPASEVHLSGMLADRGADVGMGNVFKDKLSLQYGGYGTTSGSYGQLDEVCIFATSTVGTDSKGNYRWVRYIVADGKGDYKGVVRKKMYSGALLSVRCIKVE